MFVHFNRSYSICEQHVNLSKTPKFMEDSIRKIVQFQRNSSKNLKVCIKMTKVKRWKKPCWRKTDHKSKFGSISTWFFQAYKRIFPISCHGQKAELQDWPGLGIWASWTMTIDQNNSTVSREKSDRSFVKPRRMVSYFSDTILSSV